METLLGRTYNQASWSILPRPNTQTLLFDLARRVFPPDPI